MEILHLTTTNRNIDSITNLQAKMKISLNDILKFIEHINIYLAFLFFAILASHDTHFKSK